MQATTTTYTVAQYCDQLTQGTITVNRDYQRSATVWPTAARSYLIDTILHGYPIPKLSLYQKTDLRSRKTRFEIVDGQQRSLAILDYFQDKLRITGPSAYNGRRFSDLDETDQQKFVEYQLTADLFVAAADDEVRQVFRRINSYTVPLNPEEQRHATHQGAFKWFIVKVTEHYAPILKSVGVFSERNFSRMQDAKFFTEIVLAIEEGISTSSKTKLDKLYTKHDGVFDNEDYYFSAFTNAFNPIVTWEYLHNTGLVKPFNFYSLLLAVVHRLQVLPVFQGVLPLDGPGLGPDDIIAHNLSALASAVDDTEFPIELKEFSQATEKATNTKHQRTVRFQWLCRALGDQLIA